MNGKGDKMRPFNGKTYRDNFDRIFRKKKTFSDFAREGETIEFQTVPRPMRYIVNKDGTLTRVNKSGKPFKKSTKPTP